MKPPFSCHEESRALPVARWEIVAVAGAMMLAWALGGARLGLPSLWHDELVHVFVARHIVDHGWPALPSGLVYPSSLAYNYLLAAVMALFGDGAEAVRAPSVVLSGITVMLLYALSRRLMGRAAALTAAYALALSPWHVAWSREARMYELQAMAYLFTLYAAWAAFSAPAARRALGYALLAALGYLLGVLSSFHSLLVLGPLGAYAGLMLLYTRALRSRWTAALALCGLAGIGTLAALWFNPNPVDQAAVFQTGLGGYMPDPQRLVRLFYIRWLQDNLSLGFLLLALAGTALVCWKEKRRGLYLTLAFWVPLFILTFLIGYRRPRFMYFAFPLYVALFSYALVQLPNALLLFRRARFENGPAVLGALARYAVSILLALFCLRVGISAARLINDSIETARGADTTLAVRHQQWKKPCAYVRNHRTTEAVLATSFLPALYYIGHVDDWFPNRYTLWEFQESGKKGLGSLAELQAFVQQHPRGFFLAEEERFEKWRYHTDLPDLQAEVAWVRANMTRIDAASSNDVALYAWGFTPLP